MDNKIVSFGSPRQCGKSGASKDIHIMQATNTYMDKIKYKDISELLKSIPEIHHDIIEKAVRESSYELLGVTIVMALFEAAQDNIKKALYP